MNSAAPPVRRWGWLALPLAAAVLAYWPALRFGWVWDDPSLLEQLPEPGDWASLWHAAWQSFLGPGNYLRPLPLLMLGAEKVSGGGALLAHLDNILLHGASSCLVALVALRTASMRGNEQAALVTACAAGVIYALHPALAESAAWASARCDQLLCFFSLGVLAADAWIGRAGLRALAAGLLFLCAALSKEAALGLALLLPAWHWMHRGSDGLNLLLRRHPPVYLALLLAGLVYLGLRALALGQVYEAQTLTAGAMQRVLLVWTTLGKYALLSAAPFFGRAPIHYYALPLPALSLASAAAWIFAAAGLIAWRRRWSIALGLGACWLLALLPVLNLVPLQIGDNYAHERFLALPLVFFCIGAALLAQWIVQRTPVARRRMVLALFGGWLACSLLSIESGLPAWRDNLSLWSTAYLHAPQSIAAQANLFSALSDAGQLEQAHALADQVRGNFPASVNPMLESDDALLLHDHGAAQLADPQLRAAAAKAQPADRGFLLGQLGYMLLLDGDYAAARTALSEALALAEDKSRPAYFLGIAELVAGDPAGRQHLEQGLALTAEDQREIQRRKAESFLAAHGAAAVR